MGVRDSATSIVNAFGRGYNAVMAPYDEPGPAQQVSPFAPGTVTPGAIAAKSLASLIYGHRAAANARLERDRVAKAGEHRDLQIQVLRAKLNPPVAPTRAIKVPGTDQTVNATEQDIIKHPGAFREPRPSGSAPKRLHMEQGEAQRLGIPWDAATGTVDDGEARSSTVVRSAKTIEGLRSGNSRRAETRLDISTLTQQLSASDKTLADIKASEERYADAGATRTNQQLSAAGRILLDAAASPNLRAKAAKMLGVRPAMTTDQSGVKAQEIKDASGQPVYDVGEVKAAVEARTKAARGWHLSRIQKQNAAARAAHERLRRDAAGAIAEDGAPAASASRDWLGNIQAALDSIGGAPADTTDIIDQPEY